MIFRDSITHGLIVKLPSATKEVFARAAVVADAVGALEES